MTDEHEQEQEIENELGRQSREEASDDEMFDEALAASQPAKADPLPIILCGIYRLRIDKNVTVKGKLISASSRTGTGKLRVMMFGRLWVTLVALDELLPNDDESPKG